MPTLTCKPDRPVEVFARAAAAFGGFAPIGLMEVSADLVGMPTPTALARLIGAAEERAWFRADAENNGLARLNAAILDEREEEFGFSHAAAVLAAAGLYDPAAKGVSKWAPAPFDESPDGGWEYGGGRTRVRLSLAGEVSIIWTDPTAEQPEALADGTTRPPSVDQRRDADAAWSPWRLATRSEDPPFVEGPDLPGWG